MEEFFFSAYFFLVRYEIFGNATVANRCFLSRSSRSLPPLLQSNAPKRRQFDIFLTSFFISLMAFGLKRASQIFQNKREQVMKNVACLFVKFQSWKWAGFGRTPTKAYSR